MKSKPIGLRLTNAEARAQLETEHATTYQDGALGVSTVVRCACGRQSQAVKIGWLAQAWERRHITSFVDHPIEGRARFAVFRDDQGRQILRDRSTGVDIGYSSIEEALGAAARSVEAVAK